MDFIPKKKKRRHTKAPYLSVCLHKSKQQNLKEKSSLHYSRRLGKINKYRKKSCDKNSRKINCFLFLNQRTTERTTERTIINKIQEKNKNYSKMLTQLEEIEEGEGKINSSSP